MKKPVKKVVEPVTKAYRGKDNRINVAEGYRGSFDHYRETLSLHEQCGGGTRVLRKRVGD